MQMSTANIYIIIYLFQFSFLSRYLLVESEKQIEAKNGGGILDRDTD